MTIYRRRRLWAAMAVLLVLGAVAALLLAGRSSDGSGQSGPIGAGAGAAYRAVSYGPELAAHTQKAMARPTAIHGDGPIFGVHGRTVERVAVPYPRGRVALTFDDGPGTYTLQILSELRTLHARATFFVVGRNVKDSPATVRALRDAGMVIANHTWSHIRMPGLGLAAQRAQIARTQNLLEATIGQRPRFFRPPTWAWNRTTAQAVAEQGMLGVLFSIDTRDWSRPGVVSIVRRALQAHDGQIIALHDAGGDRAETVEALPLIVKGLRARGLEPVTLDELFRKTGTSPS
jgi:peptidoglycan/xylan/chitin deacetylase (PgdA/CDA1 family)